MKEADGAGGKGLHNASLKKHVFRIFDQLHQALWSMHAYAIPVLSLQLAELKCYQSCVCCIA